MRKPHPAERLAGLPRKIETKEQLHEALRVAMELELSTIPTYLSALYSIMPGTNQPAYDVIQSVVIEEMLHLTLAGNVLNAVGGAAALNSKEFVPVYPTRLPHSSEKFYVRLLKLSDASIDIFLKIEHPGKPKERPEVEGYHDIGQFYAGIEQGLEYLNKKLGSDKLYSGKPEWQVQPTQYYGGAGDVIVVVEKGDDPKDRHKKALQALVEIVDQGEGLPHSVFDGDEIPGKGPVPAHFFRVDELKQRKYYKPGDKPGKPKGEPLPLDLKAVYPKRAWPARLTPQSPTEWYRDNGYPDIARKLLEFNSLYMDLLGTLQDTFTGKPDRLTYAVTQMYDLKYEAQALMKIPDPSDERYTVGPSFEYVAPNESAPVAAKAAATASEGASAWYAEGSSVYHDNADCTTGNNIEPENWRAGTGGKRRCAQCQRLAG